ncbi:MAG: leucine-rich repeat protein, partial [Prevotellaceae bacterium]|nr:leucine-rich repeat protein [Prevotellaceae bacterium]
MKKLFLFLAMMMLPAAGFAQSATIPGSTLTWELSGGMLTIGGTGAMPNFAYNNTWYSSRASITTVVIKEGVTNVGNFAFSSCSNLTAVTLGKDITHIGDHAFGNCGLTSVTIPDKVISLGSGAFNACRSLTSVTIPEGVTSIGDEAFFDCAKLTAITVEDDNAYYSSIDGVLFDKAQSTLYCYPGGKRGDSYTVAVGVSIREKALTGCTGLKAIEVASNHADYSSGDGVLFTKDKKVLISYPAGKSGTYTLPDGVESIGDHAFYFCPYLYSVIISNSVKSIGDYAFCNSTGLASVTIGSSVTSIERSAFYYCYDLTSVVNLNPTPQNIMATDNIYPNNVFSNVSPITLYVPAGSVDAYKTADGWKDFKAIYAIGTGTCGENVTWSFSDGTLTISGEGAMTDMRMGSNNLAIQYSSQITSVVIEEGVTHIGSAAFCEYYGNITSVTIPASVGTIGVNAFYGCRSLTDVTVEWATPIAVPNNIFTGSLLKTLHVPAGTKSSYQTATGWNGFKEYVEYGEPTGPVTSGQTGPLIWSLSSDGTLIISGRGAMPDYDGFNTPWRSLQSSITTVVIDEGVTHIGNRAFFGQSYNNMISVTIPGSVTTIGEFAFTYCISLISVTIPAGVTAIGESAFGNCIGLTDVTVAWADPAMVRVDVNAFASLFISTATLHVPAGTKSKYETAAVWEGFGTIVEDGDPTGPVTSGQTGPLTWSLSSDGTLTISGNGAMPDYSIGGSPWSSLTSSISTVVIDEGVTHIGRSAFYRHSDNITIITIPSSVTSIGGDAFWGCRGLTSVIIPSDVTTIGVGAFYGCTGLTSITIPGKVTTIGEGAFGGCSSLTNVTVAWADPATVRTDVAAFGSSPISTATLHVPAGTKSKYEMAAVWKDFGTIVEYGEPAGPVMNGTTGPLTWSLSSDGTLTISGRGAMPDYTTLDAVPWFAYMSSITAVVIAEGVTHIGDWAFGGHYDNITSVTIPASVGTIGEDAFAGCTGLTSVTIPKSVTGIGQKAFAWCTGLTDVTVGWATPLTVPDNIFEGSLSASTALHVPAGKKALYQTATGWSLFKVFVEYGEPAGPVANGTAGPLKWSLSSDGTLTISGEGAMPDYAFAYVGGVSPWYAYRSSIKTVVIENGVTHIGNNAFYSCGSLASVTIPGSVTTIGEYAFAICSDLTSITIPGSVTTIGENAFVTCSGLTSVSVPGKVTVIGAGAFANCSKLTSIEVEAGNEYYYSANGILFIRAGNRLLQYPAGKAGTQYTVPANVTDIEESAFSGCTDLTSVTIPGNVKTIGEYAFSVCFNLKTVNISAGVTAIGLGAFGKCTLTDVTVAWTDPATVTVDAGAFDSFSTATLHVPAGTKSKYETAAVWKNFGTIVEYGDAPNLSVSPSTLDFAAGGGTQNLTVTANTGWTTVSSASWATVSPASGSSDGTITVTAAANGGNARTATVTVSGGDLTRTVAITQAAGEQDIIVDPTPPSDGAPGYLILRLGIPTDDALSGTFLVILPPGMNL